MKHSFLWRSLKSLSLTKNMRVATLGPDSEDFAKFLESVGSGDLVVDKNKGCFKVELPQTFFVGEQKWVERNGSNRPPVPWVESSPFRKWVEWTWVDFEKCQVQGRQHIDFDPSPFDPIRPQSIRPKLFDQKGRPKSFRPISFDPFHAIPFSSLTRV